MCWHGYLNHKCINTSSGKKFIQLAVTKADLINLEFGERNLRKNQLQISHFLSDELDENSGQQPQSVPLFLSNKFWCCFLLCWAWSLPENYPDVFWPIVRSLTAGWRRQFRQFAQLHNWQTTKLASSGIAISNMDGNIIFNSDQHSDSNTLWNDFFIFLVLIHISRDTRGV